MPTQKTPTGSGSKTMGHRPSPEYNREQHPEGVQQEDARSNPINSSKSR